MIYMFYLAEPCLNYDCRINYIGRRRRAFRNLYDSGTGIHYSLVRLTIISKTFWNQCFLPYIPCVREVTDIAFSYTKKIYLKNGKRTIESCSPNYFLSASRYTFLETREVEGIIRNEMK